MSKSTLREVCVMRNITIFFILAILLGGCFIGYFLSKNTGTAEKSELIQPVNWWEKLPRPVYANLKKVNTYQSWFEVYELIENTYAIYEPYQFEEAVGYLLIGTEKAIIIDTGTGIGDLKKVIDELTDLPVTVVNTHTHFDHVGCNYQFNEIAVYNNQEGIDRMKSGFSVERLKGSISESSVWKAFPSGFDENNYSIPPVEPTILLHEGEIIDLGGRTIEVIYTPGHSPDSICLLDRLNKLLFCGDTFFPGPLYAHPADVNFEDYIVSMDKLAGMIDLFDYLCSGHNDPWVKSEVIGRVSRAFHDVKAGKGEYKEDGGIRRYDYEGFSVLIRSDMIEQ